MLVLVPVLLVRLRRSSVVMRCQLSFVIVGETTNKHDLKEKIFMGCTAFLGVFDQHRSRVAGYAPPAREGGQHVQGQRPAARGLPAEP